MADDFYKLYCEEVEKNEKLVKENKYLKGRVRSLSSQLDYLMENQDKIIERKVNKQVDKITDAFENKITTMQKKIDNLNSILNNDSTNSGLPTSKTPLNKKKHIPNSREKTDNKKGGQLNHKKHKLERFNDDDITDYVDHKVGSCPKCGSPMKPGNVFAMKDECDFQIVVRRIRHRFIESICPECGNKERIAIPKELKEENQYGIGVQNLILTLLNEGYVSMNRTNEMITGLTEGQISLSNGYIAKLQKRLSNSLDGFIQELKKEVIRLPIVHWDDTVISINKKNACLRFYGDDKIAYYTAHAQKNKQGLDEDQILASLSKEKIVMHDHNKVNYNEEYHFANVECCVHLLRDLKKVVDHLGHEWAKDLIELLLRENHNRNVGNYIDADYIALQYDTVIAQGEMENLEDEDKYYASDEKNLLKRLKEYKENYLMWTLNKEIPFSNNVSERSLRSSKTKMKVSGQFENINSARNYANIKSYLETGKRHGYHVSELIKRALGESYINCRNETTRCRIRRLILTSCFFRALSFPCCE